MFCFFESRNGGLTRDRGKTLQKVFECLSPFQIIEESLDRNSRSAKHRSSAKNIRVFGDNSHERIVSRRMEHPAKQRIAHPLPARRRQAQNKIAKGRPPGAVLAC